MDWDVNKVFSADSDLLQAAYVESLFNNPVKVAFLEAVSGLIHLGRLGESGNLMQL